MTNLLRPDNQRLPVFGYLLVPKANHDYVAECRKYFDNYAAEHNLRVARLFVEEGYNDMVVTRPSFVFLCQTIRREQPHGVLLMQSRDLSSHEPTARQLAACIWSVGAKRIYCVRGEAPQPDHAIPATS